jgi:energy-coupling factor transporter ATP-binding protein EcfA2
MRIDRVTLKHFRSHRDTTLELGPLNIVVGPNGAGKSTLVDAICYAFTGTCRGTDEGGRGADSVQTAGEKEPGSVSLLTDLGPVERPLGSGPASAIGKGIAGMAKVRPDALRAVFRPGSFLDLPAAEQAGIFASLVAPAGIGDLAEAHLKGMMPAPYPETMAALDLLEQQVRDRGRKLAAEAKATKALAGVQPDGPPDLLAKSADELIVEASTLRAKVATAPSKPAPGRTPNREIDSVRKELSRFPGVRGNCQHCQTPIVYLPPPAGSAGEEGGFYSVEGAEAAEAGLKKILAQLTAKAGPTPAPAPAVNPDADAMARARDMERIAFVKQQAEGYGKRYAEQEAELARLRSLVAALGAKGPLRAAVVARGAEGKGYDLPGTVNAVLKAAGWGVAAFETPWLVTLNGLPAAVLSKSERLRLNIAIQSAVAYASGVRVLVVDDGEVLDEGNRAGLSAGVSAAMQAGFFHQAIIIATKDLRTIPASPPAGWMVHVITKSADRGTVLASTR